MNPTIQLIQLAIKFEREEQTQRRSLITHHNDLANSADEKPAEKLVYQSRPNNLTFEPQPYCQCA